MCQLRALRRAIVVGALVLFGCTATVHRSTGPPIEGEILSGDEQAVTLLVDGKRIEVPRPAIEDIDHPGNVLAVTGMVPMAIGAAVVVRGLLARDDFSRDIGVLLGGVVALTGLPSFITGGAIWTRSRSRARVRHTPDAVGVGPGGIWVRF